MTEIKSAFSAKLQQLFSGLKLPRIRKSWAGQKIPPNARHAGARRLA
jgi:hypothetical protein